MLLKGENMIAVQQKVPDATLFEFISEETEGCTLGPNAFQIENLVKGKKIVVFGLPGAFTPTCSAQHVPGYVQNAEAIKAKGVDEIWCVSVNDAFVMGAWGKDQNVGKSVRMMADGSAQWTKALGLELDLVARGLGIRSQRYMMILNDGVVQHLAVEAPGKFEVSNAESALRSL
jgi:peroxiredoxin (alkyl hydroperoxide reductase subunit C)